MAEDTIADPARANYQALRQKYGGWQYSNFEASIKKITRPSELDEIRIAAKYFLSSEGAMKIGEVINQRLNELSDKLISFGDFMRAYKNAESGFMAMRDRCVKDGNDWVCASYMAQVEYFIDSQAKDSSTGGRGPLNDMLGKVREGYEITKVLEEKWKEYKEKGEKEKLPGYEEEEIKDIFKGILAKHIGIDRFWAVMDIRSEVEGKPTITPNKKKELINLWAMHGVLLPAQKHIIKPEEVTMSSPPTAPIEPMPMEEVRRVIRKEEDLDKRIEELRKKKELERQREKERQERQESKPPALPALPVPPTPTPLPAIPSNLDLMKDEIENRIAAEIKRRKASMMGQAGEPTAGYGVKKKELIAPAPRTTLLAVTGTESKYSSAGWIKTPVSVSVEQDLYAKYLIYRRGAGRETSFHAKTYTNIYVLRYQGAFGYTVELGFTDEKNKAIKVMLDPAPGNIINGIVFENQRKIAEFDVDESSFRKAEQFAREKNIIKEGSENIQTCVVCKKKFTAIDDEHLVDEGYICSARCYKKTEGWKQVRKTIKGEGG